MLSCGCPEKLARKVVRLGFGVELAEVVQHLSVRLRLGLIEATLLAKLDLAQPRIRA